MTNTNASAATPAIVAALAAASAADTAPAISFEVKWSQDEAIDAMKSHIVATQGAMETATIYATLAALRGAESKAITVAIKTVAAERGTSDSYAGRIAIEARRLANFVVTADERIALHHAESIGDAFNALNAIVSAFNSYTVDDNGETVRKAHPWRTMYDRLAALDPEAVKRAEVKAKAAEAEAKATADRTAAAEAAAAAAAIPDAFATADAKVAYQVPGATSAFEAVVALLADLNRDQRALILAEINKIDAAETATTEVAQEAA